MTRSGCAVRSSPTSSRPETTAERSSSCHEWVYRERQIAKAKKGAGKTYRLTVDGDGKATNMSAFAHFADYTGGTGGASGAFFEVNVVERKILSRAP